MTGYRYW